MPKIGIIGGSGLYNLLKGPVSKTVETAYGKPSDVIDVGKIGEVEVAFLARHGKKHQIPPHMVNYRANIQALKELGVERVLSFSAVGSLKEDLPPGQIVIPDQFVDFTKRRNLTFYDGPDVYHISAADPFCSHMNTVLNEASTSEGFNTKQGGTYVCIEGPRFSTRSESKMFRTFADIIGMTLVPEVNLAMERAMCYSTVATVTDYDVWADHPVETSEVLRIIKENEEKVPKILQASLPEIASGRKCNCSSRLDNAKI
ncbi:MAG: S-methyl-5'-thioadenosine phosphorylase [Candidatus Thermoplasmatota archaeon]|jgi:5'-methylthioadenosine phosphorylase|nr:S-methyl-5'-thioadenosine phosphorylase [Candidatus Thermoplasmatota archaeon]MCL5785216.1 S-methyl-5'-thioadenosine phosphorylase [Candidatus Thermoplasmatota archaeon]